MPRREPLDGLAAADDRAQHVDREHALDALDGELVDPGLRADDACVRDEGGERPHRLGGGEGGEDVGLDGDVGAHRARHAAGGFYVSNDRCRCGGVIVVGQADRPPFAAAARATAAPIPRLPPVTSATPRSTC